MIIEVNTKLLDLPEKLNLNQLIFLSIVLDKNQKSNQNVRKIVSLISDEEIQYLVQQGLITLIEKGNSTIYQETDKLISYITPSKDLFDVFYEMYPVYVLRPDGSKSYLRANVHKCRHYFNVQTGNSIDYKEHIINCLKYEIDKKTREGRLSYMKTMWRWLIDHQWEETEEEMQDMQNKVQNTYGTELI